MLFFWWHVSWCHRRSLAFKGWIHTHSMSLCLKATVDSCFVLVTGVGWRCLTFLPFLWWPQTLVTVCHSYWQIVFRKIVGWSWNFPEIASLMLDSYSLAEILLSGRLAQLTFFLGKGAANGLDGWNTMLDRLWLSCRHVDPCNSYYSFSNNHGSGKWLYLKGIYYWRDTHFDFHDYGRKCNSKKSPTGPTEGTTKPEYLLAIFSQLTDRGPMVRSYLIVDELNQLGNGTWINWRCLFPYWKGKQKATAMLVCQRETASCGD